MMRTRATEDDVIDILLDPQAAGVDVGKPHVTIHCHFHHTHLSALRTCLLLRMSS
jgi:hypothetical protein